jgi:hypothetical protein
MPWTYLQPLDEVHRHYMTQPPQAPVKTLACSKSGVADPKENKTGSRDSRSQDEARQHVTLGA